MSFLASVSFYLSEEFGLDYFLMLLNIPVIYINCSVFFIFFPSPSLVF